MNLRRKTPAGFTLLELLIVISIIIILAAVLYPVFGQFRRKARVMQAGKTMNVLTMALDKYKDDWHSYPPDDTPSTNGSEIVWYYLCQVQTVGQMHYGPYIKATEDQLKDADTGGNRKFMSPLGGEYKYGLQIDSDGQKRTYLLVDPGEDMKLGGSIDPNKGWLEDDPQAAKDNIFSTVQMVAPAK
ncbi:MAG TPA: prepilin-type N-terminal cleavage/methylation domain-containing protein [Planctomycetota bacterium]|nr:prepilin-type N-terminal cleavage/methylation domain-containing protein [Planctomycetota bacterium]